MFKSDSPIKSKNDDLLGRTKFAESLGKAILEWKNEESIVIGLYGKWGSGKSSVLNLATEFMESEFSKKGLKDKEHPIIIRFNPWNFTDQNQLITIFFTEIAKAIKFYNPSADARKVGQKLITYSKFFSVVSLVPGLDPYAKTIGNVIQQVGISTKEWGELKKKNLEQYRNDLDDEIKKFNRKIVIIIDDIDRLTEKEIKQIFQLVKLNANFPNTLYLLSLDQIKALKQINEDDEFLEKIIQVNFHVPAVEDLRIREILFTELDAILKNFPEGLWDGDRWNSIFHEGYKYLFESVRNVKRYINSLQFNININSDEINPLDFFVIEAIRVFYPAYYEELARNKDLFVGLFFIENDIERGNRKKQFEEMFKLIDKKHRQSVKNLILELFPQVAAVYRNQAGSEEEAWFKEKRVCAEKRFGNYFNLNLAEGEISQQEMNLLIKSSVSQKHLNKILQTLLIDGRIRRCLQRLPEFVDSIPEENIENFILSFYDISDKISRKRSGELDFGVDIELVRLNYYLIKKLPADKRFISTKNIILRSKSLEAVLHFVSIEENNHIENKVDSLFSDIELKKLIKLVMAKLNEFSKSGEIINTPSISYTLYCWKKWGDESEAKAFTKEIIKSPKGIVSFLKSFSSHNLSTTKNQINIGFREITGFVSLQLLKKNITELTHKDKKSLSSDDLFYVNKFSEGVDDAIAGKLNDY